jgi:hypothetical protein
MHNIFNHRDTKFVLESIALTIIIINNSQNHGIVHVCLGYRLSLFLRFCRLEFETATAVRHAYGLFCTLFIEYDFYVFKKKQYLADVTKKRS